MRGETKMHDCRRTKEQLIDLVFDEAPGTDALRAEVAACPTCRAELRALEATMRTYQRATDAASPSEDSWAGYHARLAARLHTVELEHESPQASPASFASRFVGALKATWR